MLLCGALGFVLYPSYSSLEETRAASANWQSVVSYGAFNTDAGQPLKMAVVLILAVTSANLMHTGFQQRIWAAKDNPSVVHGLIGASLITLPFMLVFGLLGMIAYAQVLAAAHARGVPRWPYVVRRAAVRRRAVRG